MKTYFYFKIKKSDRGARRNRCMQRDARRSVGAAPPMLVASVVGAAGAAASEAPAFDCQRHFGKDLCGRGLEALSEADKRLARESGLRVFVYLDVPSTFHQHLFLRSRPTLVKKGLLCDFASAPCTPPDPSEVAKLEAPFGFAGPIGARPRQHQRTYEPPLNAWIHAMKHCADVPLLIKLLALGALPPFLAA